MAFFAGLKFTNNILRLDVSYNIYKFFSVNSRQLLLMWWLTRTTWKVSKYEVFSDLIRRSTTYIFSPYMGKYGPEKTPYLDIFHAVNNEQKYFPDICNEFIMQEHALVVLQKLFDKGTSEIFVKFQEKCFFRVLLL